MTKRKLQRFAEVEQFPNVIKPISFINEDSHPIKGNWHAQHFKNSNPITLELGCGRGEYTVGLGRAYEDRNFIGIDVKGARLWRGSKTALEESLVNVAFLRIQIERIESYFEKDEVNEIWITFPDPHLKSIRQNKRLTSPRYLERYDQIMKPNGVCHLKTDCTPLYEYTRDLLLERGDVIIQNDNDIYSGKKLEHELLIQTNYEQMFLEKGSTICYLSWQFKKN